MNHDDSKVDARQVICPRPSMEVPNADTVKAMAEVEYMIVNSEARGKIYSDAESMMEDVLC